MDRLKKRLLEKAYRQFFEAGMNSISPRPLQEFIDGQVIGIGTAVDEKLRGIADVRRLLQHQYRQMKGLKIRWKKTRFSSSLTPDENTAVFADDVYLMIGTGKQEVKMYIRFSIVLHYNGHDWKVIHWHGSKPEEVKSEEDTYGVVQWKQKAVVLQQLVDQKTADLLQKNRELAIEAALEKVRAVAMGMKERTDMLQICSKIAQELKTLGLKEIRNVQTAIFQVPKGAYMNYEFYAKHNKTFVTETLYTNHPVARAFARKMLKGKGEVSITHIRGKQKVKEWLRYQKGTNVFIDTYLNTATSLSYYWYSLGPVALGISAYQPLPPEDLKLFERFLKVFELAYQRYLDIENAEAQAREAQLEAALERIRAVSMAMRDSSELGNIITKLYAELSSLDTRLDRCFIMIVNPADKGITWWLAGKEGLLKKNGCLVPLNDHPSHRMYLDHWKYRRKKWRYFFGGQEKRAWDRFGFTRTGLASLPGPVKTDMTAVKNIHLAGSAASFGLLVTGSLEPLPETQLEILSRFTVAFDQAYTRFQDLQMAEKQARESQIEAALERVRSRSMAMHSSDELKEVIQVVYGQMVQLNIPVEHSGFILDYKNRSDFSSWIADQLGSPARITIPYFDTPYYNRFNEAKRKGLDFFALNLAGKEKNKFYRALFKHLPGFPAESKKLILKKPALTISTVLLDHVALYIENFTGIPYSEEENAVLMQFGKAFQQAYTRFLDLQKAEGQAREAEIQLALERVRARTMAMQKSEELHEVSLELYHQMEGLGVPAEQLTIGVVNEPEKVIEISATVKGNKLKQTYAHNIDEPIVMNKVYRGWKAKQKSLVLVQNAEELSAYNKWRNELVGRNMFPVKFSADTRRTVQVAFFSKGMLALATSDPRPKESRDLLERFAGVFDLTYTRFLDLKNAESQAQEAEIQLALERVRARTMAMQKSEELASVVDVLYEQFSNLKVANQSTDIEIGFINEETGLATMWASKFNANQSGTKFELPMPKLPFLKDEFKVYKNTPVEKRKELLISNVYSGKPWKTFIRVLSAIRKTDENHKKEMKQWHTHNAYFSHGFLTLQGIQAYPRIFTEILARFARTFEQTYTRFLDLQKAEAQAKESEIQLALERVRARTMAMQQSSELREAANLLFQQMQHLGMPAWSAGYGTWKKDGKGQTKGVTLWMSSAGILQEPFYAPVDEDPSFRNFYEASLRDEPFYVKEIGGTDIKTHYRYMCNLPVVGEMLNKFIADGGSLPAYQIYHLVYFSHGFLLFITYEPVPEAHAIFKRFGNVFEQTYTRFLDLQRAEAQAREAQIETALERVRARALAMHNSNEFMEVAKVLREQMGALGQRELETSAVHLYEEDPEYILSWRAFRLSTDLESDITYGFFKIPKDSCEMAKEFMVRFNGEPQDYTIELSGTKQEEWYKILFQLAPEVKDAMVRTGTTREKRYYHLSRFTGGALLMVSSKHPAAETIELQKRAAQVLDLAFRRFKDLQKAEAQAREAQIEAALERVRSQAMAMRHSADLLDIVVTMRTEFTRLGHEAHYFWYMRWLPEKYEKAMTSGDGTRIGMIMSLPRHIHGDIPLVANWEISKEPAVVFTMDVDAAIAYVDKMVNLGDFERVDPQAPSHDDLRHINGLTFVMARTAHGEIGYSLPGVVENPPADDINTLIRFAGVFDLAYRRFEDLKEAERRNRETQIELALERVRARTMAMQASHELQETAAVLFNEFKKLGTDNIYQVTIGIYNEEERMIDFRVTSWAGSGEQEDRSFNLSMDEPIVLQPSVQAWKKGRKHHVFDLSGELLEKWLNYRNKMSGVQVSSEDTGGRRVITVAYFSKGHLSLSSPVPVPPETIKILERFANVFDGTYTRFLDLEKAEAQARESNIEAALERVRSKTLAMQRSDELADTAAVVFQQLILLGIEPNRLYIAIVKEDEEHAEFWITDEDGSRVSRAFETNLNDNGTLKKMLVGWKRQLKSLVIDMQGEELQAYFAFLTGIGVPFKEGLSQKRRIQEIAYFSKGFIGMASPEEQPAETLSLLERFAAVFNLTFTRFNDLKLAEAHAAQAELDLVAIKEAKHKAEEALTELQSTQKQLIQSEKMASLGELTAGIAHEIQNPLNFVNNFSEVSRELLEELNEELAQGNIEGAREIMQDLTGNLEKINHHGKRADGIVKGMLQHSRSGSGQQEPTDINTLCDEYLRLAYHGLRAKDKSFNAKFETEFDNTIGKVNVLPQDMGRVILNLINNAFYAVTERKKTGETGFEPRVLVSTIKSGSRLQINVRDNGIGIPPKVLDKIFQPFFTTKPTGQGTGLGLSLSYDIIKAHGGELKVETKEGEGTTFFIVLPGQEIAME